MLSQRYLVAIADLKSGLERRVTVSIASVLVVSAAVIAVPVLVALGAVWKARSDVQGLYASHRALEIEAANYRAAVEALTRQIESQPSTLPGLRAAAADSSESGRFLQRTAPGGRAVSPPPMTTSGRNKASVGAADSLARGPRGADSEGVERPELGEALARLGQIEARLEAASRDGERPADPPVPLPLVAVMGETTAVRPVPPLAPPADVEMAVRHVIAEYLSGLESRSLMALKRVWPSLGGSHERAIQTEFENARTVRASFTDPHITVNGDTTTVTGFRTYALLTQDGQHLSSVTKTTMTLRRSGDEWLIEHVVHRE